MSFTPTKILPFVLNFEVEEVHIAVFVFLNVLFDYVRKKKKKKKKKKKFCHFTKGDQWCHFTKGDQ